MKSNGPRGQKTLMLMATTLAVYVAWVAATYLLEGRIHLLQTVDPVGRITYVSIANIAIGIVLSILTVRYSLVSRFISPKQIGLAKSSARTAIVIIAAALGSFTIFVLQNPRTLEPIIVFNVFMQALPVSIAEVVVCWALIGTSFEAMARKKGKIASVLIGAIAASVLFAGYHYAHSPPFNQTPVVLFLLLPSIATAVTYFVGRDVYAAIIVQNFMGIFGVLANLPNLDVFRQPMIPIYALSAVSIAALVISYSIVLRKPARQSLVDANSERADSIRRNMK